MEIPTINEIADYQIRQQKFIEENGLNIGDKVKITRKANDWEEGWNNIWTYGMDEAFDEVGTIEEFEKEGFGIRINFSELFYHHFSYPYFIIEKA